MVRTQIYLTAEEKAKLGSLARRSGRKQSALIREAIDRFLARAWPAHRPSRMRASRGMWKDRAVSEFRAIRQEVQRRMGE